MARRPIRAGIRTSAPDGTTGPAAPDTLRDAFASWATGVAVLAVNDGDEVDAITVTAFSPVSLDPPLVMVCVREDSAILPMLLDEGRFAVSVLPETARRTASIVAGRHPIREVGLPTGGNAVVPAAVATFVCSVHEDYPGGDHRIVIGKVERTSVLDEEPLLYFRREYRRLDDRR